MKQFIENWRNITHDPAILTIAENCQIEFDSDFSYLKNKSWNQRKFNKIEEKVIDKEIEILLDMKVIIEAKHEYGEVISPIFTVPKKNGEYRMILNLKELNQSVAYHHFKMDTFESTIKLINKGDYMASVDLRHAYYSVPIALEQQKFLRFLWKDKLYQYTCLPNGIGCAPRLFTKLLKPVYSTLRQNGHVNSSYIDDSFLSGGSFKGCLVNVDDTVNLLEHVGFMINVDKSVLIPTKKLKFLGNLIDSELMIVTLPEEKVQSIIKECKSVRDKSSVMIRQVAKVLGLMVSTFSAVEFGPLHYRTLEKEKILALSRNAGNFDAFMSLSQEAKTELTWWIDHLPFQKRSIDRGNPKIIIVTDSSGMGWGAVCDSQEIGGRWTEHERSHHINYLELLAAFYGLRSFCKDKSSVHVQIKSDNVCCISYINNLGGLKSVQCNELAVQIWEWCIARNIWISAVFVPGIENPADASSRKFKENIEWMLNPELFDQLVSMWGSPDIDLFATRLNRQTETFVSWHPDPDAAFINAFSADWSKTFSYMFPPFSLVTACLRKIRQDQASCIFVCPLWTTQIWWPILMDLLVDFPRILPKRNDLLIMPGTNKVHPLFKKLKLIACSLSGAPCKIGTFLQSQSTLSWDLGDLVRRNNILHTLDGGFYSVRDTKLIQFKLL